MESTRLKKVSRLLERDLGEIFQLLGKRKFPGLLISVSKVRVSPDLGVAKAYLSIFPQQHRDQVYVYIKEQTNSIRNDLGHRVGKQLRVVPELNFYVDDSLDYEENIDRLLRGEGENPIK